jgi:hypothetical protein
LRGEHNGVVAADGDQIVLDRLTKGIVDDDLVRVIQELEPPGGDEIAVGGVGLGIQAGHVHVLATPHPLLHPFKDKAQRVDHRTIEGQKRVEVYRGHHLT